MLFFVVVIEIAVVVADVVVAVADVDSEHDYYQNTNAVVVVYDAITFFRIAEEGLMTSTMERGGCVSDSDRHKVHRL